MKKFVKGFTPLGWTVSALTGFLLMSAVILVMFLVGRASVDQEQSSWSLVAENDVGDVYVMGRDLPWSVCDRRAEGAVGFPVVYCERQR